MSCMCSITAGLFFICVVIFSLYISQKWLNIQVMKAAMGYSTVLWVRQWSGTALTAVFVCELKQRAAIVLTLIHSFSNWRALHFTLFKEHNRTPYTFIFFLDKFRKRGRNHSFPLVPPFQPRKANMPPPGFGLLVDGWEQVEGMDSSSLSVPAGEAFMKALHIHRIRLQQQSGDGTKHK